MNIKNNCKRATILIEKQLLDKIGLPDAVFLQMHLFGCLECRIYKKQSRQIDKQIRKLLDTAPSAPFMLNDFVKDQLQIEIKRKLDGGA